ncbi:glycosyltransferase [bacterium]|nr:MAG: glycosyltransferase [bacterium]
MSDLFEQLPRVSVVVPLYNEESNVAPLVEAVHDALSASGWAWELILVDDGSSDRTVEFALAERERRGAHLSVLPLRRNFGQTAAMQAGLDKARGNVCVTLDGDLQNDPSDIPALVRKLVDDDFDLVVGWRKARQDGLWLRLIPSRIANKLIRRVTGVRVHDYGCSLKAYRTGLVRQMRLYGEMHRFIPAWAAMVTSPARIGEIEVQHHPRRSGESKYGLGRVTRVMMDLLVVHFFLRYRAMPGHFFGAIGLVSLLIGTLALLYLAGVKFILGEDIGSRPLLMVGILCVIGAVQFITTGVVTELLARAWLSSPDAHSYVVHDERAASASEAEWG